jgi:hypothetical protein
MIHDETRSRWEQFSPEKFINMALNGTLREKINTAYMVIHVYTQIIHHLPATATMRLDMPDAEDGEIGLRDLFIQMRDSIAVLHDRDDDDTPTMPRGYTPGDHILHIVRQTRLHVTAIRQANQPILADARVRQALLPGLNGRRVGDVTTEILKHMSDITQILDFAQNYAENITHHAQSRR